MTLALADSPVRRLAGSSVWSIVTTPPWPGDMNMAYDLRTLAEVERGRQAPTLRFFRWSEPTATFGRLQKREAVEPLVPADMPLVQRPTGGGLVIHDNDLCVSLVWRPGEAPLPKRLRDCYQWVHGVILEALAPLQSAAMATCHDCAPEKTPFGSRSCFTEPVVYDLLANGQKIVGGALYCRPQAMLYQGSLQFFHPELEPNLRRTFSKRLTLRS